MTFKEFLFLHGYSLVGNPGHQVWKNSKGELSFQDRGRLQEVYDSGLLQDASVYAKIEAAHPDQLLQPVERHEMGG